MKPPLIDAAILGVPQLVRQVLEKGAHPDTRDRHGETALTWASHLGHTAVVKDLLAAGADREARGSLFNATPILLAARGGYRGIVSLLSVLSDLDVHDSRGATPLMVAVEHQDATLKPQRRILSIVKTLLDAGARINLQDHRGNTALIWAVVWGNHEVVKMLLEAGADLSVRNDDGQTALGLADELAQNEIIGLLHLAGAFD